MAQISVTKLEEIPCNLCGADQPKLVYIDNSYRICRCRGCSLIYVNPQPVINFDDSELYPSGEDWAEHIRAATKNIFAHGLEDLCSYRPDKGALLDVGCGYGFFWSRHKLTVGSRSGRTFPPRR